MASNEKKIASKTIKKLNTSIKTGNKTSNSPVHAKEKSSNSVKKGSQSRTLSPQEQKSSAKMENIAKDQPIPLMEFNKQISNAMKKKIMPMKVPATSKKRTLSTKKNIKNKTEQETDVQTVHSLPTTSSLEMPKLRTIIDNMTSFVKIDHEKIYPLLDIFVDYVYESLPDSCPQKSFIPDDSESLPDELKDTIERYEKQKIMDPLISPLLDIDDESKKSYDEKFMQQILCNILPILRKCNGNVNFKDKSGQTILHVFIKRYVVIHKIISKEDLKKLQYKNSPEEKLRAATFKVIKALLNEGASVDIADVECNTPLHTLVKRNSNEDIMKLLLERYTETDNCDKNGDTVLHLLVGMKEINKKHLKNIRILASKGADMHKKNINGIAPIHLAFEFCHLQVVEVFDKKRADFNSKSDDGKTPFHFVCISSSRDDDAKLKLIDLLINKDCDVNVVDSDGYSAIHYAAKFSSRIIIKRLINLRANVFYQIKEMKCTPLHLASKFGCCGAINTLIEAGVNVNILASAGIIPLHLAILYSDPLTVECLIINGADVKRKDTIFGFASTHLTVFVCREKLDLLVKKGADVNAKNKMGITPLHLASMLGNVEVIEGLCEHGADLNCKDNLFGMTPLHWASMKGKRLDLNRFVNGTEESEDEVTISEFWKSLFLKTCLNCEYRDYIDSSSKVCKMLNKNQPSVCTVIFQPKSDVIKALLKYGAHADMQDNDGRIALYNIVKNDNVEGMKYFLEYGLDFNNIDISNCVLDTWNSVKVRSYILWNAMKLRIAGLPIAEVYLSKVIKPQFQSYHSYWEDEVKKLKRYMIDENVSLHDLMLMNIENRCVYVERVLSIQQELEINFQGYCSLILASCRQAIVRKELERLAKFSFTRITNFCLYESRIIERVFLYLSNVDLRAIVECVGYDYDLLLKSLKI